MTRRNKIRLNPYWVGYSARAKNAYCIKSNQLHKMFFKFYVEVNFGLEHSEYFDNNINSRLWLYGAWGSRRQRWCRVSLIVFRGSSLFLKKRTFFILLHNSHSDLVRFFLSFLFYIIPIRDAWRLMTVWIKSFMGFNWLPVDISRTHNLNPLSFMFLGWKYISFQRINAGTFLYELCIK